MILPRHILASAHVVPEILQLILRVHIRCEDRFLQILEKVAADHRLFDVGKLAKLSLIDKERDIALLAVGVEPDRQLIKIRKVLPEQVRVFFQQLHIPFIPAPQLLDIRLVKSRGHNSQAFLTKASPLVQAEKAGISRLIIPAELEQASRSLQLLLRGQSALLERQEPGVAGVLHVAKLRHAAGDLNCLHKPIPFVF